MNKNAKKILQILINNGYQAYIVGGAVRDLLFNEHHKTNYIINDWDIATNATPEQTKKLFNCYDSGIKYGTVTAILNENHFEITTFRTESEYLDGRRPTKIKYSNSIEKDLARRDFTINAIAMDIDGDLIDPYRGKQDIQDLVLKAVGIPRERIQEDALRILRGFRFAITYSLKIDHPTLTALIRNTHLLKNVSKERQRDELLKVLKKARYTINPIKSPLFDFICLISPYFYPMWNHEQHNPHHDFTIWEHTYYALKEATTDSIVKLAILFHDIGKPKTYTIENGIGHFYKHNVYGADLTTKIMTDLKFPVKIIKLVSMLVLEHTTTIPNKTSLKKLLNRIDKENFYYWIMIREADIKGQKEIPDYSKLEKLSTIHTWYKEICEEEDALQIKDLKITGNDLITIFNLKQGKNIGYILNKCLNEVIENNVLNDLHHLLTYAMTLIETDKNIKETHA